MLKSITKLEIIILFSLLFCNCAQVVNLSGGKKDLSPPKLIEAIPNNNSVLFDSETISIKFDEFIKLNDLNNQLIICPKIKTNPEISVLGKELLIRLKKEELLPNTTYRFYFGSSIIDMHEGNPLLNFEYVFSTGTILDSIKISGKALNAFNNKPIAKISIGLYENKNFNDSIPFNNSPVYLTKTNEEGLFVLPKLPSKSFIAIAFLDKNKNNQVDGEIEKRGFLDQSLNLLRDTNLIFRVFDEIPSKSFVKKIISPYYGFTQIILNQKTLINIRPLLAINAKNIFEINLKNEKDTVSIYYKNITDTLKLVLSYKNLIKTDTLIISLPKENNKKKLKSFETNLYSNILKLNDVLKICFLNWMDTNKVNLNKIKWESKEDSLINYSSIKGKWINPFQYQISSKLKQGANYKLKFDTLAFFDLKGNTNDSIRLNFKTQNKLDFGKVSLKILFNKKQNHIIQLIDEKENIIKEQSVSLSLSSSNSKTIDFIDVEPANYFLKIIYDTNENKKWDTGNFILKHQPEKVYIHSKQLKVVSDWEIEEDIFIKE